MVAEPTQVAQRTTIAAVPCRSYEGTELNYRHWVACHLEAFHLDPLLLPARQELASRDSPESQGYPRGKRQD
jgi:hypothetical protein